MIPPEDSIKRLRIKEELTDEFNSTLEERIDRCLEIDRQWIVANHHFAAASAECIRLYQDGYFISTVMMSHAINEGIIKFVAERNNIKRHKRSRINNCFCGIFHFLKKDTKSLAELLLELKTKGFITDGCYEATYKILKSFRADVHHMTPTVMEIPFRELAKENVERLAVIEKEIFDVETPEGKLKPKKPQYWDLNPDGTVNVFLRLSR